MEKFHRVKPKTVSFIVSFDRVAPGVVKFMGFLKVTIDFMNIYWVFLTQDLLGRVIKLSS
jgi:hypothetical protein